MKVRNIHELWKPNEQAVFDYSLDPDDPSSEIARLIGHRTGQIVTVLDEQDPDRNRAEFPTFAERGEAGAVVCYRIRFPDGLTYTAFEDELLDLDQPYIEEDPS